VANPSVPRANLAALFDTVKSRSIISRTVIVAETKRKNATAPGVLQTQTTTVLDSYEHKPTVMQFANECATHKTGESFDVTVERLGQPARTRVISLRPGCNGRCVALAACMLPDEFLKYGNKTLESHTCITIAHAGMAFSIVDNVKGRGLIAGMGKKKTWNSCTFCAHEAKDHGEVVKHMNNAHRALWLKWSPQEAADQNKFICRKCTPAHLFTLQGSSKHLGVHEEKKKEKKRQNKSNNDSDKEQSEQDMLDPSNDDAPADFELVASNQPRDMRMQERENKTSELHREHSEHQTRSRSRSTSKTPTQELATEDEGNKRCSPEPELPAVEHKESKEPLMCTNCENKIDAGNKVELKCKHTYHRLCYERYVRQGDRDVCIVKKCQIQPLSYRAVYVPAHIQQPARAEGKRSGDPQEVTAEGSNTESKGESKLNNPARNPPLVIPVPIRPQRPQLMIHDKQFPALTALFNHLPLHRAPVSNQHSVKFMAICKKSLTSYSEAKRSTLEDRALALRDVLCMPARSMVRKRAGKRLEQSALNLARAIERELHENKPGVIHLQRERDIEKDSTVTKQAKRCMSYMYQSQTGKAARALEQRGLCDTSDPNVLAKLVALHPRNRGAMRKLAADAPLCAMAKSDAHFKRFVKNADKGASPGPSGWTERLLAGIVDDDDCAQGLADLINDINNATFIQHEWARDALLSAILIAAPKSDEPDPEVRPITMPEALLKLAESWALDSVKDRLIEVLGPYEYSILVNAGAEAFIHISSAKLLDSKNKTMIIADDIKNAFNSVDRAAIETMLRADPHLATLVRPFHFVYEHASRLWTYNSKGMLENTVTSERGVRQGLPLSMAYYALKAKVRYEAVQLHCKDVIILRYADNVQYISSNHAQCVKAAQLMEPENEKDGLSTNRSKRQIFYFHDDEKGLPAVAQSFVEANPGMTVERHVCEIMGSFVGRDSAAVSARAQARVKELKPWFEKLQHSVITPQAVALMLNESAIAKGTWLARTLMPACSVTALQDLSDMIFLAALSKFFEEENLDDVLHLTDRMSMPVSRGGWGLTRVADIRHYAYLASVAASSSRMVSTQCPVNDVLKSALNQCINTVKPLVASDAPENKQEAKIQKLLPPSAQNTISYYASDGKGASYKLQKQLTDLHFRRCSTQMHEALETKLDQARWNSTTGEKAGRVFKIHPTRTDLRLNKTESQICARMWAGLTPFPASDMPKHCKCGASLVSDKDHWLSCPKVKRRAIRNRHDAIVHAVADGCQTAGMLVNIEPSSMDGHSRKRPDLEISASNKKLLVEVSVVCATAPSHINVASTRRGQAAFEREEAKIGKYKLLAMAAGAELIPFVVEAHGTFGLRSLNFIKRIVSHGKEFRATSPKLPTLKKDLTDRIAIALWRHNASAMRQGIQLTKHSGGDDEDNDISDSDD
jgi:hypothetical protein